MLDTVINLFATNKLQHSDVINILVINPKYYKITGKIFDYENAISGKRPTLEIIKNRPLPLPFSSSSPPPINKPYKYFLNYEILISSLKP